MAKSVNTATILGNLTRDPQLRYTPAGHAVCSFGVATNRTWKTADGEKREEVEFHTVVAWNKLAEICSQYLTKGQKVYIQGRLQTRTWEGKDENRRSRTEIVADDMVMLQRPGGASAPGRAPAAASSPPPAPPKPVEKPVEESVKSEPKSAKSAKNEDVDPKDLKDAKGMPF